ncbi:hypothetical protein ILUMI_19487 [Ignelater luminosus]|uniref:Uncharacterized protein n=1 Tax=Ignelater luminosus TaxID=2038154 RepID=A0A8K0CJ83_IGNLU|nr:hypothetical protein ILUMI_19487 [Ignelater luminosus]
MDCNLTIQTLEAYKKLTEEISNHNQLLKEKTIILYVATLLDSKNREVLDLCLDILEIFIKNNKSHEVLTVTFGVIEALESLSIRLVI